MVKQYKCQGMKEWHQASQWIDPGIILNAPFIFLKLMSSASEPRTLLIRRGYMACLSVVASPRCSRRLRGRAGHGCSP